MHGYDEPVYLISIVSSMLGIHPQTLRQYERDGLIKPSRTQGRIRLYSQRDIDKMKMILRLTRDLGVNMAGIALWKYILEQAKEHSLSGATVYKAVAGVGSNYTIHTFDILNLSNKMPIVIEIIDESDKITKFLNSLEPALKEAFATLHDVNTIVYN